MNLNTIEDQVGFLEKQADALHLEVQMKIEEHRRLKHEIRKLKLLHAEKFYGMSAAECRAAYHRIGDLVSEDYMEPAAALRRRNDENPGKEITEAQYQELMMSFAGEGYG